MEEKLLKIINHYGLGKQLKYFNSEVYELNEAIIKQVTQAIDFEDVYINDGNKEHITNEMADVLVMLEQIRLHYGVTPQDIEKVMKYKVDRQLKRMEEG